MNTPVMKKDGSPYTLKDALRAGYKVADSTWERGYISRKIDPVNCRVYIAGGSRKGELYALVPSWQSTQFCERWYLVKEE